MTAPSGLLLGLDCATDHLALAIVDPESGTLAASSEAVGRAHASLLPGAVAALLARAGARPADVGVIGVGIGPGSYTGVRVALATAKGLARAWGAPLGGVSSLLALAAGRVEPGEEVLALSDARRGNRYAQRLRREASEPWRLSYVEVSEPMKASLEELTARYSGMRWIEGLPPDAAAIAWAATAAAAAAAAAGRDPSPYYL